MSDKISVIMPVYNSESFIHESISSVLNQTYQNFELIIIDDCSSDNSVLICEEYVALDPRVKLIKNKKNMGICFSRNIGIYKSTGEYIIFIDDDDIIDNQLIEVNLSYMNSYNLDMLKFGRRLVDISSDGTVLRDSNTTFDFNSFKVYDLVSKYQEYSQFKKSNLLLNVWNGVYKADTIKNNNLEFDETMRFGSEDADFSFRYFEQCNKVGINPNTYYIHFRRNQISTSRKFNQNKINSLLKTAKTESIIWSKLVGIEKQKVNTYKLEYIKTIVSAQIMHPENKMTIKKKSMIVKEIIDSDDLIMDSDNFTMSYKDRLLSYLIKRNQTYAIVLLYYVFKKIGGEKWD